MGNNTEPDAAVGNHLRVHGVRNLRVLEIWSLLRSDASHLNGNKNAPTGRDT